MEPDELNRKLDWILERQDRMLKLMVLRSDIEELREEVQTARASQEAQLTMLDQQKGALQEIKQELTFLNAGQPRLDDHEARLGYPEQAPHTS